MPKLRFNDPVGPGTPAWDAFDRAREAYASWRQYPSRHRLKVLKRYYNQRQYMMDLLRKYHQPTRPWTEALNRAIKESPQ